MTYRRIGGLDDILDQEVSACHNVKNKAQVLEALTGYLPRYPDGRFSEKIQRSDVRAALALLKARKPWFFPNPPPFREDEEVLKTPFENLKTEEERQVWLFAYTRRNKMKSASEK